MQFNTDISLAHQLDAQDELASLREAFVIHDPDTIYLDGNSLGRLPKPTAAHLADAIERQWGQRLIRSWNESWMGAPHAIGDKIARLIGAQSGEVIVSDSTSIALFKLAVAALHARPGRTKIVSDELNFPSDLYIFQGIIELLGKGHKLELVPSQDGISIAQADLEAAIDETTALVGLTHVAFKSAFMYDMEAITETAQRTGALTLWDLSHSVGAVPLELNAWGVDLAVGCCYKYLNGGPGAPAFLYVREDLQDELMQPIWGWFAAQSPFDFELDFTPAAGISRFKVSSPPVLSMLAIEPALDLLLEAGMQRLRAKSVRQSEYLIHLAEEWLVPLGFELGSPRDPAQRGSHVSLRHPEGYRVNRALIEPEGASVRVIPDFRTPDNIRLGIAPLYTSFSDVRRALDRMRAIVETKEFERFPHERLAVT
ncbi:MAG: kynureninase [Anaerolineales bacterium]|jgi:kynureninase